MNTQEQDIVVSGKTKRILAFDLIRGLFLIIIMIDHIELFPDGWSVITGKGRMWVSAAEGFFFLSGLLIGMIYKRRLHLGMKFIFKKMWRRAAELYVVGTALTFIFLCWVEFTHHTPIKDNLPSPFPWHHYIYEALLMRFTYGWADFLVRFAILMLIAPFVFYLVAKRKWWLALIGIIIAWAFRGRGFTLAWQLIFNSGIIVGFYWQPILDWFRGLGKKRRHAVKVAVAWAAGITFLASYASVYLLGLLNHLWGAGLLPHWLQHVTYDMNNYNHDIWLYADKWTMGPLRIALFFTWFPVLYWIFHKYENWINKASRGILELLGRNSLVVYTIHAFIVFTLKMYFIPENTSFLQNFLITTAGLATLILIMIQYKKIKPRLADWSPPKLRSKFLG